MKKHSLLFVFILTLSTSFLPAQELLKKTIYFDHNKFSLSKDATSILEECYATINSNELIGITITGHTDLDGSDSYNAKLSKSRTDVVANYFQSKGITSNQMEISFLGETLPINGNNTPSEKRKNRRVEIALHYKNIIIGNIFDRLKKESQFFKVSNKKDIEIKGNEGTIITIPKNSLVTKNGKIITETIEIELQEFYKKSDIIEANLHTMSDGKILESGGMVFINVKHGNENLQLKRGATVQLEFASRKDIRGMDTFYGEEKDDQINWVPKNNSVLVTTASVVVDDEDGESRIFTQRDTILSKENTEEDKLILKSNKLGWINCDRFYKLENKTDLIVKSETSFKPHIRLIFKDINSIMPINFNKQRQEFLAKDIPVGQKATLIAFYLVNEKPYFFSKEIIIQNNMTEKITLVETTMEDFKINLKSL